MKIDNGIEISRKASTREIIFKRNGITVSIDASNPDYSAWNRLYKIMCGSPVTSRPMYFDRIEKNEIGIYNDIVDVLGAIGATVEGEGEGETIDEKALLTSTLEKIINFFKLPLYEYLVFQGFGKSGKRPRLYPQLLRACG